MKILIIPDVHGRTFWRDATNIIDNYDKIIFLGDYVDPYGFERITPEMAYKEFKDILAFKDKYKDKVILLLGNHDLHYYKLDFIPSSRREDFDAIKYHEVYDKHKESFTIFKVIEDNEHKWIFSHGGIAKSWLEYNNLSLDTLLNMSVKDILDNHNVNWGGILEQISRFRWGPNEHGSPVWVDIEESRNENMNLGDNITQIVGHNQVASMIKLKEVIFTDCHKLIELDTNTKEIKYVNS